MQVLRISVAVVLLLNVSLSSAQQADQIVSKVFPADIVCRRNSAQRDVERQESISLGGSETLYRACYLYTINSANECELDLSTLQVIPIPSTPIQNSSVIMVNTPLTDDRVYPTNTICFFVIGNKRDDFVYQYFEAIEQDVEGSLDITTMDMGDIQSMSVTAGACQDFFEFRMKSQVNAREVLTTCGDQSDPRIRLNVDIADALTFVFKSDGNNPQQYRGVNITIIEINSTAANLYGNVDTSRRRRSENSEVVAPQGPEGLHGETGLRGAPGTPGRNGNNGRDGSLGIKGERGIEGVRGPEGPPGTEGTSGPTGLKGPHGPNGIPCHCPRLKHCTPGKQGKKGPPGSPGYRGDPGEKGARGSPGRPGPRGIPGQKGRKGSRGPGGYDGLNGASGDQGPPGFRGQPGPVGPPGLGGCPAPDHEMTRRALELGYITKVTEELYYSSTDKQYRRSVRKFHNHMVTKLMEHKETLKRAMSSQQEASQLNSEDDQDRFTRQTEYSDEQRASSIECGGVPILPGPQGEAGVRGPPGIPGKNGIRGRPGINGADGMTGDPGEPGMTGPSGSPGSQGYPGGKGIYGQRGDPGSPGQCSCFKYELDYHYEPYRHPNTRSFYYPTYGSKGQHGEKGYPGPKGIPGYRGHPGSPGSPGAKGRMGYRGVNGVTGRTGRSGLTGPKGYTGFRGLPGNAGPPGPPGPPGCACNNLVLYLDRYGFLIDPMNINTTEIGDEFEQVPVNITCIRMEDSPIIGQKGEQGSPGYPGPQGYPGKPGADGMDGYSGRKGAKGEMGYIGQKGFQGSRGPRGKPGLLGSPGPQGYPGKNSKCVLNPEEQTYHSKLVSAACPEGCSSGLKGSRGEKGSTGPRGLPGYRGPPGYPGPKGPRGIAGLPGDAGDDGFAGSPGQRGSRGRRGLPGAPGPAGPQGPPGPTDDCPEYDGVDFDVFFRPTPEEMMNIEQLFATADMELAMQQTEATYPYLRELAGFISGEGEFPPPTGFCAVVINTTTVGKDLITVEFRGTGPFTCQLDHQPPVPCTSPITYSRSELRAGFHTVNITGGNNTCAETTNFTLPVELVISPPVVDCDMVTISFSSNGRTQCQLDRRYFTDCQSPYRQSGLRGGKHTVTIRATDGRGQYKQDSVMFNIILDKPQWGAWNEWSSCSRSCGTGRSYRKRTCVPAECPDPYRQNCDGSSYEGRKCNEKCCPEKPHWSSWTYWSACSKSCGGGIQFRKRKCIPSNCPYSDPKYNKCNGSEYEEKKCNEQCCYEKPHWGEWKDWSACSKSCGGGVTYRRRECYQSKCPHPYYTTCYGNKYEQKRCNEDCCPEKPYWGSWSYWSACSKTCGGGISFRKRHCYQSLCQHPVYKNCTGNDYEQKKCNDRCCPAPIKFIGTPQVYDDSVKISYISSLPTECSLDRGSYEYCKSPYQQSNLKPGAHTLAVRTTGNTECQEQNSAHFYITNSGQPYKAEPEVYIPYSLEIKVVGIKQHNSCVWIRYTLSHYASTLCSFDNKSWTYCYSPVSSCGLKPGQHTVSIKATDRRTSQTATANYKFTVY